MATVEALAERLLLVETLLQQTQTRVQTLTDQQTIQMQSHTTLHAELRGIATRTRSGGLGSIDKVLMPSKYGGDKSQWRQFAKKLINCVGKAHPELIQVMKRVMGQTDVIDSTMLGTFSLPQESLDCLSHVLTVLLEDEAWAAVENHLEENSLEQWRILSCTCDPRGAYTELTDTRSVTNPARIKSAKGIVEGITAWEGIQIRHQLATGVPILTEHAKKYSLMNLMPLPVEKVLEDHVYSKSYHELRAYIISNVVRWEKLMGGASVSAVDLEGEAMFENENGELFPLERRGNNRFKMKTPMRSGNGGPKQVSESRYPKGSCFRCGKTTHRIAECKESVDINGKPCKAKRYENAKGIAAVSGDDDQDQSCLDLSVLDHESASSDAW